MTQIQLRRGTASEWAAANPVLAAGEVGIIGTTGDFKIGDGATTWNLLPAQSSRYAPLGGAWTAVTFQSGWVNYGAPFQPCQYRKVGDIVEFRGTAKTGTIGNSIFALPAGFRPPNDVHLPAVANSLFAMVTVNAATGAVVAANGSNVFFTFDLRFSVTA